LADHVKTQVNTSAMKWRLAVHEELPNGGAKRWLAGGERRCVLTSTLVKRATERQASPGVSLFIGEGVREGVEPVPHVNISRLMAPRSDGDAACVEFPCPGSLMDGLRLAF
jgi:hypothetical protein